MVKEGENEKHAKYTQKNTQIQRNEGAIYESRGK